MNKILQDIYQQLGLTAHYTDKASLDALQRWCHEHISQDIRYVTGKEGAEAEAAYSSYLKLLHDYAERFLTHLPHLSQDFSDKKPQWGGMNAIQYAAQQGYDRFILSLGDMAPEVLNERTSTGMTALHWAAANGWMHAVMALLKKGADVHIENAASQLPIQSALFVPVFHDEAYLTNKSKIFKVLMAQDPQTLLHQDNHGDTVFHVMAIHGFSELLFELLEKSTKGILISNKEGQYPIHSALLNHQSEIVAGLLRIAKVPLLADFKDQVALHYAAQYSDAAMVQWCCAVTADKNLRDTMGKTPLILAKEAGNTEAVEVLISNGADPEPGGIARLL